ncbi:MAG TPA: hypothetical protein V6C71_12115 [Coleofasciculaceae cyanobacterium]|jgi:hypothetical protein
MSNGVMGESIFNPSTNRKPDFANGASSGVDVGSPFLLYWVSVVGISNFQAIAIKNFLIELCK